MSAQPLFDGDDADLFVTQTGSRLHIPGCPHVGSALSPASPADRLALPVCSWCRAELDGTGRTYFSTLDDAMRAHGMPVGTERRVREVLRFVTHDQVWRPYSGSYVALGCGGRGVAWVGEGYVFVKATNAFIELPGYRTSGGGGTSIERPTGEVCELHNIVRSMTGECDSCD